MGEDECCTCWKHKAWFPWVSVDVCAECKVWVDLILMTMWNLLDFYNTLSLYGIS